MIPLDEQVEAMLSGQTMALLDRYVPGHGHDVRSYLSVTREDILSALKAEPNKATDYYERVCLRGVAVHDVTWLAGENGRYRIFSSEHGKECDVVYYDDLTMAVTDHVLETHGLE